MSNLVITIGEAKPQGSKKAFVVKGRAVLVEASKDLKAHRNAASADIAAAAKKAKWKVADKDTPVSVTLVFQYEKPKTVKRKYHTVKPDVDKLVRYCLDAITNAKNVWHDDSQVIALTAVKIYGPETLTRIEISRD
jgi:Holliday junction resolvase RusA-like endonuclease